jgi:hypothetical protein
MKAMERRVRLVVDRLVVHRLADRLWLLDRHREAEEAARRAEAEKAAVAARARAAAEAAEAARRRAAEPPVPTTLPPPVDVRPRVPSLSPSPSPTPTPHPYDPPEHMQIRPIRWGPSVAPYDPDDRVGRVLHEYDPLDRDDDYDLLDED